MLILFVSKVSKVLKFKASGFVRFQPSSIRPVRSSKPPLWNRIDREAVSYGSITQYLQTFFSLRVQAPQMAFILNARTGSRIFLPEMSIQQHCMKFKVELIKQCRCDIT